jgi:hypothetical protein
MKSLYSLLSLHNIDNNTDDIKISQKHEFPPNSRAESDATTLRSARSERAERLIAAQ